MHNSETVFVVKLPEVHLPYRAFIAGMAIVTVVAIANTIYAAMQGVTKTSLCYLHIAVAAVAYMVLVPIWYRTLRRTKKVQELFDRDILAEVMLRYAILHVTVTGACIAALFASYFFTKEAIGTVASGLQVTGLMLIWASTEGAILRRLKSASATLPHYEHHP